MTRISPPGVLAVVGQVMADVAAVDQGQVGLLKTSVTSRQRCLTDTPDGQVARPDIEAPRVQSFDEADEIRALPGGRVDLIRLGGLAFDRATFVPGWRWSEQASAASCRERHLGYLVSGCMRFRMDDGTEVEATAGDVYLVPPGHDAWVVGDVPCVALDLEPLPAGGRGS